MPDSPSDAVRPVTPPPPPSSKAARSLWPGFMPGSPQAALSSGPPSTPPGHGIALTRDFDTRPPVRVGNYPPYAGYGYGDSDADEARGESSGRSSSSSSSSTGVDDDDNDPIAEDSKEVLLDRLNDVVRHVASYSPSSPSHARRASRTGRPGGQQQEEEGEENDENVLSTLHARVDEMESALAAAAAASAASSPRHNSHRHFPGQRPKLSRPSASSLGENGLRRRTSLLDAASILISRPSSSGEPTSRQPVPPLSVKTTTATTAAEQNNPHFGPVSQQFANDCDGLADDLSAVLASLVKTTQESERIQQTLLRQLAEANARAEQAEAQVQALADVAAAAAAAQELTNHHPERGHEPSRSWSVLSSTQAAESVTGETAAVDAAEEDAAQERWEALDSELSFLRLQLRAIELRCRAYVPDDADPELAQSIENWKADWSALRAQADEERRNQQSTLLLLSTTTTPGIHVNNNNNNNNNNTTTTTTTATTTPNKRNSGKHM